MGENPSRRDRFFSNRTQFSSLRAHSVGRPISRRHAERPRNGRPIPREESSPEPRRRRHRRRPRLRLAVHAAHHASRARARRLRGPPAGRRRHGASARARGGIFGRSSLASRARPPRRLLPRLASRRARIRPPSRISRMGKHPRRPPTRAIYRSTDPIDPIERFFKSFLCSLALAEIESPPPPLTILPPSLLAPHRNASRT